MGDVPTPDDFPTTERTRIHRRGQRARYDRPTVHAILDEGLVAHVGFVVDGRPVVLPMTYARDGDTVYLHGSRRARLLELAADGAPLCLTVTLLDGMVLARSTFNHSMNYRTVVIHGTGRLLADEAEQARALTLLVERLVPGRGAEAREPNAGEMKATAIVAVALEEVSAKVRSGPPHDDEEDATRPIWAGVLPVKLVAGVPEPSADVTVELPAYVARWRPEGRGRLD